MKNVLFITHAGKDIGGGHLSRCIALSQAFLEYGISSSWLLNYESKMQAEKNCLLSVTYLDDPFDVSSLCFIEGFDEFGFTIIDSYTANEAFLKKLSEKCKLIAVTDDSFMPPESYIDVLINYSFGATSVSYKFLPTCCYLLGPSYALLRKEFWDIQTSNEGYVLFVPGAADVANVTEDIIDCWQSNWPRLLIAVGAYIDPNKILRIKYKINGSSNISAVIDSKDFALLMSSAEIIICSASVTAYEALAMKKKVAVFCIAENQESNCAFFEKMGVAYSLGRWDTQRVRTLLRGIWSHHFNKTVDGHVNSKGALLCVESILS